MVLGLYYLTYAQMLSVRKKGTEGEGKAMELAELWNPETASGRSPRATRPRAGREWTPSRSTGS